MDIFLIETEPLAKPVFNRYYIDNKSTLLIVTNELEAKVLHTGIHSILCAKMSVKVHANMVCDRTNTYKTVCIKPSRQ